MAIKTYRLDPDSDVPYGFDLSKYLEANEVIESMDVEVLTGGIIDTHDPQVESKRIMVFCKAALGVTEGLEKVTLRYETDLGRIEDRSFYVFLKPT